MTPGASLPSGYKMVEIDGVMTLKSIKWYKRKVSLKGRYGKWTKWGGAEHQIYQPEVDNFWYCQLCGEEMPEEITPYLFEFAKDECLRICPECYWLKTQTKVEETFTYVRQSIRSFKATLHPRPEPHAQA